jgi:acetolactate synthase-1/2/3 large subunit
MADVRTFLRQLHAELDRRADLGERADARHKWLEAIDGYRKEWDKLVAPGFSDDSRPINPQRAAIEIGRGLPKDAILVSDIGVHHNWLLGYCKPRRPDSLIGSMGFGPMGFGVAGVLGAKFAAPDRPCVSVCGDGAFFMHSAAASWPRTSTIRKPASVTIPTLPPWRAPRASKASASIGPRTWPRLCGAALPRTSLI